MKQAILTLLIFTLVTWSCDKRGDDTPIVPDPIDTIGTDTSVMLGCKDTIDINHPGQMTNGYLSAVKTCRDWKASARLSFVSTYHFLIQAETYFPEIIDGDTSWYLAEILWFNVPRKLGKFQLIDNEVDGTFYDKGKVSFIYFDDDAGIAGWDIDTVSNDNWIEIEKIDYTARKVKGQFCVNLSIAHSSRPNLPDRLRFYDGVIEVGMPE